MSAEWKRLEEEKAARKRYRAKEDSQIKKAEERLYRKHEYEEHRTERVTLRKIRTPGDLAPTLSPLDKQVMRMGHMTASKAELDSSPAESAQAAAARRHPPALHASSPQAAAAQSADDGLSADINNYFTRMKRKAAAKAAEEAAARKAAARKRAAEERAEAKMREAVKKEQERRAAIKEKAEHEFEEYRRKEERKIREDEEVKAHDEKIDSRIDETIEQVAAGKAASAAAASSSFPSSSSSPLRAAAASDATNATHAGVSPESTRPKVGTAAQAVAHVEHTGPAPAGAAVAADTVLSKEVAAVAGGKHLAVGDLLGDLATVMAAAANSSRHADASPAADQQPARGSSVPKALARAQGEGAGAGEESWGGGRGEAARHGVRFASKAAAVVVAEVREKDRQGLGKTGKVRVRGGNTHTGRHAAGVKEASHQDATHLARDSSGDNKEARQGQDAKAPRAHQTALQQAAAEQAKAKAAAAAAATSRAAAAALGRKMDAVLARAVSVAQHAAKEGTAAAAAPVPHQASAPAHAAQVPSGGGALPSHTAVARGAATPATVPTRGATAAGVAAGAAPPPLASLQVICIHVLSFVFNGGSLTPSWSFSSLFPLPPIPSAPCLLALLPPPLAALVCRMILPGLRRPRRRHKRGSTTRRSSRFFYSPTKT